MKSSPEPVWKQHRRNQEKVKGSTSGGGTVESGGKAAVAATGSSGGTREGQVLKARKLTHRLGKASAEGKFSKDEVLEVLQRVSGKVNGGLGWWGPGGIVDRGFCGRYWRVRFL